MDTEKEQNKPPEQIAGVIQVVEESKVVQAPEADLLSEETVAPAPVVMQAAPVKPSKFSKFKQTLKQKKVWIPATAMLALLVAGSGFMLLSGQDDQPSTIANDEAQVSRLGVAVTVLDGKATYSSGGDEWSELTTESELSEGDEIKTDALARLVLSLDDGSAIRLDESTTITLTSLEADDVVISNKTGELYSRVVTSDRSFTVTVDEDEFKALGTAFNTVNEENNKGVKVLQSKVSATEEGTEVSEGQQYLTSSTNPELVDKVTELSLEELKANNFLLWNLEQDEKDDKFKDKLGYWEKLKAEAAAAGAAEAEEGSGSAIKLSASNTEKGTVLSWTLSGVSAPEGFKIVRSSKSTSPVFGKDEAQYVNKSTARSYTWGASKGGTYHYRVCIYKSGSCSNYSNVVSIESPYIPPQAVEPGAVNLSINEENTLSWTFGGTAPHGFKVLVSSSNNPTYPNNSEAYATSPYTLTNTDKHGNAKRTAGIYYVRVCKYTASSDISGGCTDYSNEVQWIIP